MIPQGLILGFAKTCQKKKKDISIIPKIIQIFED